MDDRFRSPTLELLVPFHHPKRSDPAGEPPQEDAGRVIAAWSVWWLRYRGAHELVLDGVEGSVAVGEELTSRDLLERIGSLLSTAPDLRAPWVVRSVAPQAGADASPRLTIVASSDAWRCRVDAVPGLVSDAVLERLPQQLTTVRAALVELPDRALEGLPMLTSAEAAASIRRHTGPAVPRASRSVIRAFEEQVDRRPDAIAVETSGGRTTYAQLDAMAETIARRLDAQGVRDGGFVLVPMEACVEQVAAMLGIFKAGGVYVPVDPAYPASRIAAIVQDARPRVALVGGVRRAELPPSPGMTTLEIDDRGRTVSEAGAGRLDREVLLEQTAYLVFTSGTTGRPKGVVLSHANLAHYIDVAHRRYGYHSGDVIPAMARPSFSISFFELLSPLCSGGRLVLPTRDEVLDLAAMRSLLERVTCIHASPSWWRTMLAHLDAHPVEVERFEGLRHVSSGGDMVPPDVVESMKRWFPRAEVFVIYGSSEIACMGCSSLVSRDRELVRTRVGLPFPNVSLRLLDPAGGVVPPGFPGEVCFGGEGIATGYLGAPELTASKFVDVEGDRIYHTGDVGVIEEYGELRLLGRRDFQIKLRGVRIEPAEIEAQLRRMPQVRDAVVAAVAEDGEALRLVAYLVASSEGELPSARILRARLREDLPEVMVPSRFVVLDAMPLNHNGKVDRRALPLPTAGLLPDEAEGAPPTTELERRLLELWRRTLGRPSAGIHDDFFDLGGDSLAGAELMTQIDHELGVPLPVSELLEHPTVAELAPRLAPEEQGRTSSSSVVLLRPGAARPAFFFVHDGGGESIVYRNLARDLTPGCPVYGIHPKRSGLHPILHTRISEMVEHYAEEIRRTCSGPYVVGGLCIGGFLAFEVARRLRAQGHEVPLVVLLDAPHVSAPKHGAASKRLASLSSSLGGLRDQSSSMGARLTAAAATVARKAYNTAAYELRSRAERRITTTKIRALRRCLDLGVAPPRALAHVGVDPMLRFAELEYVVPAPYSGEVLLVRATKADPALADTWVDDTPYREIIDAPANGWEGKAAALAVEDVEAGHSSMLQARMAPTVAAHVRHHLERVLPRAAEAEPARHSDDRLTAFVDGCSVLVVMVSYRSAELAVESLAALEAERSLHRELKVVVVDNTSGDDARTIDAAIEDRGYRGWAMVRVSDRNGGFAYGNNVALRPALRAGRPPPRVWLLNPDTRVEAGAGRALAELLDREPRAGLAGSCLLLPDGEPWGRAFRYPSLLGELEAAMGLGVVSRLLGEHAVSRRMGSEPERVDWLSGASLMVRREVLESAGLFDDRYFLYFEETDFTLQAKRAGWDAWYVPDSRVVHIAGSSTGMSSWFQSSRRIPRYYFDSRRRYFLKNHGLGYATMTDVARVLGLGVSWALRPLRPPERRGPSHLIRDSLRSAALLRPDSRG